MVGKDENETTELWRPPKEKDLAKGTAKLSLCLLPQWVICYTLVYFTAVNVKVSNYKVNRAQIQ